VQSTDITGHTVIERHAIMPAAHRLLLSRDTTPIPLAQSAIRPLYICPRNLRLQGEFIGS